MGPGSASSTPCSSVSLGRRNSHNTAQVVTAVSMQMGNWIMMYSMNPTDMVPLLNFLNTSSASGFRPPPSRVPNPPAEAARGMRSMKNIGSRCPCPGFNPMLMNTGTNANTMMTVTVASCIMVEAMVHPMASTRLSRLIFVPANLSRLYMIRLASPTSLSTTPNMMIMSTNMTAGLAKGAQAFWAGWILRKIRPAPDSRAVVPMETASLTHRKTMVARSPRRRWPSGVRFSGLGNIMIPIPSASAMINLMMIDRALAGGFTDSISAIRYYSPKNNGLMVYGFVPAGLFRSVNF